MRLKTAALLTATLFCALHAGAAEDPSCKKVRFADVGWSDIAATTGLASVVLEGMGYKPTVTIASIPITFAGMKNRQIDVFLGYWNPSMTPVIEPFVKANQIKVLEQPNLVGAKYTLAVPDYLYDKGLKTFADIAKFEKDLQGKIHGIEPGNDGNALIAGMIKDNKFGLKSFKMVESSEAGMLVEAQRAIRAKRAIVFLGWEPHPMNVQMKMRYLAGGDEVFGPNLGEAKVYTAVPPSYETRCPNVTAFLKNLRFTTDMENQVMGPILDKVKPNLAARNILQKNPAVLEPWLKGVKTFDGKDALAEVSAALKR
ncbi:MAG: choline ABC transporter substrate-binding protein [Rhodoferax sp.]|nr:choline ABC transporter substrate-binding protein [Rhodoferax sp.]